MIGIAPTDLDWFEALREEQYPSAVNFWTPTPWNPKRLDAGDRFYFLLKAPYRKIGGYGRFLYYENMSAREAWNRFGKGNGVNNLSELVARASRYAERHSVAFAPTENPAIGCIVLSQPVFFDEDQFFRPEDYSLSFPRQVVKFKYFDVDSVGDTEPPGSEREVFQLVEEERGDDYRSQRVRNRKGQPAFRQRVLAAYGHRCCVTGESSPEVLNAAHIQPYVNRKSNHVQNGLCLRTDLHKLFDAGLITLDDNYRLVVSEHLISKEYAAYHGQEILLPSERFYSPSNEALTVHRDIVFRT
jgi:putative restriction endonuclease